VPLPPLGYWAKKRANKAVRTTPLPAFTGATTYTSVHAADTDEVNPIKRAADESDGVVRQRYYEALPENAIVAKDDLLGCHRWVTEHLNATETYMRMALKAQSQCRTTIEALAEIKNPRPVAFVKQANIAHGHQQINNGVSPDSRAHGENSIQSNELLEVRHGERLDARAASTAIGADTAMATLGESDRATNR
jgi:hypothetical protein